MPGEARWPWLVLLASGLLFVSVIVTTSLGYHAELKTQMNDVGNADQAIWSASQGDLWMIQSNTNSGETRSRISVHANFLFYAIAPLYRLFPDPRLLLALPGLAGLLTGLGLFAFAMRRLGDPRWAVVAPVAFWLSPTVHDAALYDFHIINIAAALLVWMVWAFDAGRSKLGWTLLVLALLCKEDIAFVTTMYGAYAWLSGRRRQGAVIALASLAYFALLQLAVMPAFNRGDGLLEADVGWRYRWLRDTGPAEILTHLLRPDRLRLPLYLLLAGGIFGLGGWRMLLLAAPQIGIGMLSVHEFPTRVTGTYYYIIAYAAIVLACVLATEKRSARGGRWAPFPLAGLGVTAVALSLLISPLPHSVFSVAREALPAEEARVLASLEETIPGDASLCVQNNIATRFTQRENVYRFATRGCRVADYVLIHVRWRPAASSGLFVQDDPNYVLHEDPVGAGAPLWRPGWQLIEGAGGFYLFLRDAAARPPSEAHQQFKSDAVAFRDATRQAVDSRPAWARYLVDDFTWEDLAK